MTHRFALFLAPLFLIYSCSKEASSIEKSIDEETVFVDQGTSIYADANPDNDVFFQAFWWDSFNDTKISPYGSFYKFLKEQAVYLSNANIDMVWMPPPSEGEGMGYHPRQLFDFNSLHGKKSELQEVLTFFKERKMHAMADLVFNHRIGTETWTDFTNPSWSCESICIDDEGYTNPNAFGTKPCGDFDEGESWGGARDLNHKSSEVQEGLKDYLIRLKGLGFDAWRYDFVKGFPGKYIGEYNHSTSYYYSVGEFWDGAATNIKNWINETGVTASGIETEKSGAFDFDLKYKLGDAIVKNQYHVLKGANNHQVGLSAYPSYENKSITFLDNHDTGCVNRTDCDNLFSNINSRITMGYAYILTHPGIPMVWGYHYFFQSSTQQLQKDINELILFRKSHGINAKSSVEVLETKEGTSGYYAAVIDSSVLVKIGPGNYNPANGWTVAIEGAGYKIWTK